MFRQSLVVVALFATTGTAFAGDPKFEFGKADEVKDVKKPEWKAAAEAGVVFTAGSSETTTATGGFKASRKAGNDKMTLEGVAAYAKSSIRQLKDSNGNGTIDNGSEITSIDTVTAETFAGKLRYDRFLTTSNSLFIAALGSRDLPAGKESVVGGQIGYSRQLYKTGKTEAVGEAGYDFSRENPVSGATIAIHSARLFAGLKSQMTDGADLDASVEFLTNLNKEDLSTTDDMGVKRDGGAFKDTRVNTHVAVSAKIGRNLAMQMSVDVKYDHRPAALSIKPLAMGFVPEASTVDTIMKASLIYTFF